MPKKGSFFFSLLIALGIFLLAMPVPAQEPEDEANPPEKTVELEVETKREESPDNNPNKIPSAVDDEAQEELDQLQDELHQIKEDIFRSKARTLLLEEFLVNTEVEVFFKNKVGRYYRLKSMLYILDNQEIYKQQYDPGQAPKGRKDIPIFKGVTTPGRHEMSVVLTYAGKRPGVNYTDRDYEFQVTGDFSFIAERNEVNVVTVSAIDSGKISKDIDKLSSFYQIDLNMRLESERLADLRRRIERRRVGLALETGYMLESFQMVSNQLSINPQGAGFIFYGGRAWWFFHQNFGIQGFYHLARYDADAGIVGQPDFSVQMDWLGFDLLWRYPLGRRLTSPWISAQLGYGLFETTVNGGTQPRTRLTDQLQYINLGIGTKIPFTPAFGFEAKGQIFPIAGLDQSSVTSGRVTGIIGFIAEGGLYWNFWKDLSAQFGYRFFWFDVDFAGVGTRTDQFGNNLTEVQQRTFYQTFTLGLRYEF